MFVYNTPKRNFTIIPNEVIDNDNLSIQAIAIYTKLRRNCLEWKFSAKTMAKKCGLNIKTFYKYLNELYKEGLIKRVQKQENGRFTNEVAYVFVKDFNEVEAELEVNKLELKQVKELEKETRLLLSLKDSDEFVLQDSEPIESYGIENKDDEKPYAILDNGEVSLNDFSGFQSKGEGSYLSDKMSAESAKSSKETNQNIVSPNFTTHNNIIDINKTKESDKVENGAKDTKRQYAILDISKLWKQCKEAIKKADEKTRQDRAKKENELFAFTSQLEPQEREAYLNYIEYRSEKKKLSKHTLKRIQAKFMQLKYRGFDMFAIVENTIAKGWTDLYPIQTKQQRKHEERVMESGEYKSFSERYKDFDEEAELAKLLAL